MSTVDKDHKGKTSFLVVKRKGAFLLKLLFASFSHRMISFVGISGGSVFI